MASIQYGVSAFICSTIHESCAAWQPTQAERSQLSCKTWCCHRNHYINIPAVDGYKTSVTIHNALIRCFDMWTPECGVFEF